jgi:membrane protein
MTVVERLDRFQRKHPQAGLPIAVIYKFAEDQGTYLAALITYYGFLSLFPLLLLMSTILNFALAGNPGLQHDVLHSALGQFPVVGAQLSDPRGVSGSGIGLAVGILGTLYGGLGVAQALQNAMNTIWRVPRNSRPNPIKSRGRGLLLLLIAGLAFALTTVLSALSAAAGSYGASVGGGIKILLVALSLAVNAAVFTIGFRFATARNISIRETLPGAITGAAAWQVLQFFGTAYVGGVVKNASAVNSVFALVLGLIAWIYVEAFVVVLAAEFNVVRAEHLYPRALLTPFTDDVDLTSADHAAYTDQAQAQRAKGFQDITVTFSPPDPEAPAEAAQPPPKD